MIQKKYQKRLPIMIIIPAFIIFLYLSILMFQVESFFLSLTQALTQTNQAIIAIKEYPPNIALDEINNAKLYITAAQNNFKPFSLYEKVPFISDYYLDSKLLLNYLMLTMDGSYLLIKDLNKGKNNLDNRILFEQNLKKAQDNIELIDTKRYPISYLKNVIIKLKIFPKKFLNTLSKDNEKKLFN